MWNFKGYLWNSKQNILHIHWKIPCLRAHGFKVSYEFLKCPLVTTYSNILWKQVLNQHFYLGSFSNTLTLNTFFNTELGIKMFSCIPKVIFESIISDNCRTLTSVTRQLQINQNHINSAHPSARIHSSHVSKCPIPHNTAYNIATMNVVELWANFELTKDHYSDVTWTSWHLKSLATPLGV